MTTEPSGETTGRSRPELSRRLRRQLLGVLLADATAVTALTIAAFCARSRPAGRTYSAIAAVAAVSLAPGVVAVSLEERTYRPPSNDRHRPTVSLLLFGAGMIINTVGTVLVLVRAASPPAHRAAAGVDIALLVGGNAIGVPYVSLLTALHA